MKKFVLLINFTFLIFNSAFPQNPLVKQWDYRFGGTYHDPVYSFQQTADGGYILGGESYSDSSGDKTQDNWDATLQSADYWIVKINSLGIVQWDKRFGGTSDDYLTDVKQTSDGGYILGGASESDSSGDKTQNAWGQYDYWIIKTDSLGNKQWDKRFGGIGEDELYALQPTADGGYILGGYSFSDSSGDKTQHTQGLDDFWMVKTDSLGIKQWDKRFGGSSFDEASAILQTSDGGYLFGGSSFSGISGDKSEPNWDPTNNSYDYWIVKTNDSGIKQWDKRFGGTTDDVFYSICQTSDGGYILNGCSKSDSTGDKTQNNWDTASATYDLWVIKINSLGAKQWDKDFGGDNDENLAGNITQTSDKGYLIPGTSYSGINGTKTENNLGVEQAWVTKTDSVGNIQWDKTALTDGHDEEGLAIQTSDGCYTIVTATFSGIGGYKTQPKWDTICIPSCTYDYWIVKFCDSTSTEGMNSFGFHVSGFALFPNPVEKFLTLTWERQTPGNKQFIIYDLFGRTVLQSSIFPVPIQSGNLQSSITINVSSLSQGIYFIKIGNEVKKFVKQ